MKGERGFAGSGGAGDDRKLAQGNLQIEVLQVVLPGTPDADAFMVTRGLLWAFLTGHGANMLL